MDNIPYGKQHIDQSDIDAVVEVLKSDWLTQGPKIGEFEKRLANYHKCKYAVAFSSGTAALHGAYYVSTKFPFGEQGKIVQSGENWEFVTSPLTFVATANAGLYCGGSPQFVDTDENTYCIDINKIEYAITEKTRVITPVSYAGYPVDIKSIKELQKIKDNNVCIIHDACHAIGALRDGHSIADYADMTILSFHPVKHITTGEGGMVLTNNLEYYKLLLLFRNHGITKDPDQFSKAPKGDWYYEMKDLGYNYRITDFQCALGISQLKKIDEFIYRRNQIAKFYEDNLRNIEQIILPLGFNKDWVSNNYQDKLAHKPMNLHSYHLFPIRLDKSINRNDFFNSMRENGVGVQLHYIPVFEQNYYSKVFGKFDNLEKSKIISKSLVTIPMYYDISQEQLVRIVELIKREIR